MAPLIEVVQGSLTDGNERVLVNASNTNVMLGSGVSGAIRRACGPEFQQYVFDELARVKKGPMFPGDVLLTNAGTHPTAKSIAHVAVMDYREGFRGDSAPDLGRIRLGCERLWDALETLPDPELSVAMVALGAGAGGLGVRETVKVSAETLKAHCAVFKQTKLGRVRFYGYATPEYVAMCAELLVHFPELEKIVPADVLAMARRL
jgi:O-acetyl-ADP-ribose deacetylase (regulator of RNase III)